MNFLANPVFHLSLSLYLTHTHTLSQTNTSVPVSHYLNGYFTVILFKMEGKPMGALSYDG